MSAVIQFTINAYGTRRQPMWNFGTKISHVENYVMTLEVQATLPHFVGLKIRPRWEITYSISKKGLRYDEKNPELMLMFAKDISHLGLEHYISTFLDIAKEGYYVATEVQPSTTIVIS